MGKICSSKRKLFLLREDLSLEGSCRTEKDLVATEKQIGSHGVMSLCENCEKTWKCTLTP